MGETGRGSARPLSTMFATSCESTALQNKKGFLKKQVNGSSSESETFPDCFKNPIN